MAEKKKYKKEYKVQAVKLGREIGFVKAAKELDVNVDTLYGWNKAAKEAKLDLGPGAHTPICTNKGGMQKRSERGTVHENPDGLSWTATEAGVIL